MIADAPPIPINKVILSLPPAIKTTIKITYWYDSKKVFFLAEAISKILPSTQVKVFQGFDHGELCIGNPELYIQKSLAFLKKRQR
jgi:hypothetical protein